MNSRRAFFRSLFVGLVSAPLIIRELVIVKPKVQWDEETLTQYTRLPFYLAKLEARMMNYDTWEQLPNSGKITWPIKPSN